MNTTVTAKIGLIDAFATTLAAPLAGYHIVASEANGAAPDVSADVPADTLEAPLSLAPGTWTAYIVAVDAAGNELAARITSNTLTVTDPVVVIVHLPHTLILSVA